MNRRRFWGPLVSGSVPVYYGAPNGHRFAPNNHSVIFAQDYESPQILAEYLKKLHENDALYEEYLEWKRIGPSKDFIALVDLSIVHSECRFCIRAGDIDRKTVGEVITGPFRSENMEEMEKYNSKYALMLKIRERGQFYLRRIHLETFTVQELHKKIYEKYNDPSKANIYSVYELWDREHIPITKDAQIREFPYGHELEIIFENPGSLDRGSYTDWYYARLKNQTSTAELIQLKA